MVAYKLVRLLKDGDITPLFINKKSRLQFNEWLPAEKHHHTKGYKFRPFWHCTSTPNAPHLKETLKSGENRVWVELEMEDYTEMIRPDNQGGKWFLANKIKINKILYER